MILMATYAPPPPATVPAAGNRTLFERAATGLLLFLVAAMIGAVALLALSIDRGEQSGPAGAAQPAAQATPPHGEHGSATPGVAAATSEGDEQVEEYATPDPTLPAVPEGDVKKFRVDVFEHVTKVADDKPASRVWSFGVNGVRTAAPASRPRWSSTRATRSRSRSSTVSRRR